LILRKNIVTILLKMKFLESLFDFRNKKMIMLPVMRNNSNERWKEDE